MAPVADRKVGLARQTGDHETRVPVGKPHQQVEGAAERPGVSVEYIEPQVGHPLDPGEPRLANP